MRLNHWVMGALVLGTFPPRQRRATATARRAPAAAPRPAPPRPAAEARRTTTSSGAGGASQTPPQGEANVKARLAAGDYKSWACQPAETPAVAPSPHSYNRICSNDIIATGSPPFAVGAAAVKELYSDSAADGGVLFGYAVYVKTAPHTAANGGSGANWYWYEDNPTLDLPAAWSRTWAWQFLAIRSTVCVSCHSLAGSDANHPGAGDFVDTQIKSSEHELPARAPRLRRSAVARCALVGGFRRVRRRARARTRPSPGVWGPSPLNGQTAGQ